MTTKKVLEAEALDVEITVEFNDEKYVIPPAKLWPLEAVEAQEASKILGFVKALLGDDQYKTLRKTAKTVSDLDDFVGKLFETLDLEPGK